MRIAQEEIFGPVLCVPALRDGGRGRRHRQRRPVYGLGAHVQGKDMDVVRDVASQIRAGQVHLNYPAWDPHAPFGRLQAIRKRTPTTNSRACWSISRSNPFSAISNVPSR